MTGVLVVDDEQSIRDFLGIVLEDEGYEVRTASNGQEALEQLATDLPDLLVLDIMMPVVDGREVLRRVRADPGLSRLAVLVMSAAADPALLGSGFDAFLAKPFDLDDLIASVARLVRG
jgi:CheY-like chemotaxis protein